MNAFVPMRSSNNGDQKESPLLRGLLAVGAGFTTGVAEPSSNPHRNPSQVLLLYCVKGSGWCEIDGLLHNVRQGDLLIVPTDKPHAYGARASKPWSVYWVRAKGTLLSDYLEQFAGRPNRPLTHLGDDPQLVRLFAEILRSLKGRPGFTELLRASATLAHLLAVLIGKRQETDVADVDTTRKVAEAIIFMSEHLDEPVRISALARQASLSPAYFSGLFKQQTGCAPRDYLHLLRNHRACHLLRMSGLSIKQIAARLGYRDQFHFSRQFKASHGVPPTKYRGSPSI